MSAVMTYGRQYPNLSWSDVNEGDKLPELKLHMSFRRVIQDVAGTRDFFPGHHEPEYAKKQNVKDIYINTMFFQGLIDRFVTDWAGPETFIRKRKIQMQVSVCAGDDAIVNGQVTKKWEEDGQKLVQIELAVMNQEGAMCCPATVVAMWP